MLDASMVRGAPARVLTDIVLLVRFAVHQEDELVAFRDHVAANLEITPVDLVYAPFAQWGGLGRAFQAFGPELNPLLDELTEVLAA